MEKAPQVKILNLSKNKVGRRNHMKFGFRMGGSTHQDEDKKQAKGPEGENGGCEHKTPGVSLSLGLLYKFPLVFFS
jgi:hypothetical protein